MKYFTYTVIGIVAATVIAGFFIVGSPKEERLRRFDSQRVSDLQFLQSEILNYWQNKKYLPKQLTDIQDSIRGINVPKDPETGANYGYEILGDLQFNLCAVFDRPSTNYGNSRVKVPAPVSAPIGPYYGENWDHMSGNICFERTIDKDFYSPKQIPVVP